MKNLLVIPDLHIPFEHRHALSFCQRIYKDLKCSEVVHIGDLVDNHAISYHEHDPNGLSPEDEIRLAIRKCKAWYKAFPKVKFCRGNHDQLVDRKGKTSGLPERVFRPFRDIWDFPDRWVDDWEFIIDGVKYMHGTGYSGKTGHIQAAMDNRMSTVIGHIHSSCGVNYIANNVDMIFGMNVGCVDMDTEYLSPMGWRKISEYDNGFVMQVDNNLKGSFVMPKEYIVAECEEFNYIKTKYGVSQVLCDNHNFVYFKRASSDLKKINASELVKKHNNSKYGFQERFPASFTIDNDIGIPLEDSMIRLLVAIFADATIRKDCTNLNCVATFKKQRKIKRFEELLNKNRIKFKKVTYKDNSTRFKFKSPIMHKGFSGLFYGCNKEQLEVICDEVFNWDGDSIRRNRFSSAVKSDADFIQFAFCATGKCATLKTRKNGKGVIHIVIVSKNKKDCGISSNGKKNNFVRIKSLDNKKYCFTVPSGMIVLRNNGCVFITGNCLIDRKKYAFTYGKDFRHKPILACGVVSYTKRGINATIYPMQL